MPKGRVFQAELSDDAIDDLMVLADKEIVSLSDIIAIYGDDPDCDCSSFRRRLKRMKMVRETLGEIR